MLAGDSAGGNLALGVLSHISRPHPQVPRLELAQKLCGLVLLSPWISFKCTSSSMRRNRMSDVILAKNLISWAEAFLGQDPRNSTPYSEPLTASAEWWKDAAVEDILLVGGSYEIMVDDLQSLASKLKVSPPKRKLHTAFYGVNAASMMNLLTVVFSRPSSS